MSGSCSYDADALKKKIRDLEHELQKSREESEIYRALVEQALDAIAILCDMKIVYANQAFLNLFGLKADEDIAGTDIKLLFTEEQLQEIEERLMYRSGRNDVKPCLEMGVLTMDGRRIDVEICAKRFFLSGKELVQWVVRNITVQKSFKEELIKSNEENRRLTKHALDMLTIVSHDIRSPLIAIASTLKLLKRGIFGKLEGGVIDTIDDLLNRVVGLCGTVENCLGKTSAFNGSIVFEKEVLDLRKDIIDPVLEEFIREFEEKEILLDSRFGSIPADKIPIKASKMWLKNVYRNLISNAIKYGGRGCTIAFGFEIHGSYYKLNVYNSGKPIPEEEHHKLFSKFTRIKSGSEAEDDGVGLGLYMIKQIIQKHGGDIWYEAMPSGSNFVFTILKD
nr:PAS domain-containing sensor histidine kinase [Desulfobacterales bacterium]